MEDRRLYVRVGIFLGLALVLVIGSVFLLTSDRWVNGIHYETYFRESVQGLDIGSPVRFRGVAVGNVTHIALVSADYGATAPEQIMNPAWRMVVVRFKVDPRRIGQVPDTPDAVQHGLRVRLASQGLTGVTYLEVDFVDPTRNPPIEVPWTPDYDYIPSVPSAFTELGNAAQLLLDHASQIDLAGLSKRISVLLDQLTKEVSGTGDVHATLREATATLRSVREAVERANLPALSAQFQKTGGAYEKLANDPATHDLLRNANQLMVRSNAMVAELQGLARRTGDNVADLQAALVPILADAHATVQNLRDLTEDLRRDPAQVLFQQPPARPRAAETVR